MFFNSEDEIVKIAKRCNTTIFVESNPNNIKIKNALYVEPEEKTVITIEQIRTILEGIKLKQNEDQFIIIRPADKIQPEACNTLLKTLEEPGEKIHFILITKNLTKILPTIRSRSTIYLQHTILDTNTIYASTEIKELSKRLLAAKTHDLINIAEEISKKKERSYALEVLSVAIEMAYKTYYLSKKEVFLNKIPKLINAYDNIAANGHIKLHLVADLC